MSQLEDLTTELAPLGQLFRNEGFSLYLVGGIVRDGLLGTLPPLADPLAGDIDLTTEARPDDILRLVRPLATALWTQGERFGTIGAEVFGRPLEITTHRAEQYDNSSRKPAVTFGDDLDTDLSRRDFTINAMAIELAAGQLIDPYGGEADLARRRLRTPLDPRVSFGDDPLRMLRAARFIPRFDLTPEPDLVAAVEELRSRLDIVSVERIHDELERLLGVDDPTAGLRFALDTGLLAEAVGEPVGSDRLRLGTDLAGGGATMLERRSRLLWPFGPADARAVLRRLRYSNDDRDATLRQLALCELFATADLDAPTIRRAADLSRGEGAEARAIALRAALGLYEASGGAVDRRARFEQLLEQLGDNEDLSGFDGPLDGDDLMRRFGLVGGPIVGRIVTFQRGLRYERGAVSVDEAAAAIGEWLETNEIL